MNRKLWKLWPIEAINKIEELEAVIAEQTATIAKLEKQLPDKRNLLENTIFDARAKVFDVISVEIATKKVKLVAEGESTKKADAAVTNATEKVVSSVGKLTHFYVKVPHGKYINGDTWGGLL